MNEFFGPTCVGKSTLLLQSEARNILAPGPVQRGYYTFIGIIYLSLFNFRGLLFLIKIFPLGGENIYFRLRATRNSLEKFGIFLLHKNEHDLMIDEGISQIPYIYLMDDALVSEFIKLFFQELSQLQLNSIFDYNISKAIHRIELRGHKRTKTLDKQEIYEFIYKNKVTHILFIDACKTSGLDICFKNA